MAPTNPKDDLLRIGEDLGTETLKRKCLAPAAFLEDILTCGLKLQFIQGPEQMAFPVFVVKDFQLEQQVAQLSLEQEFVVVCNGKRNKQNSSRRQRRLQIRSRRQHGGPNSGMFHTFLPLSFCLQKQFGFVSCHEEDLFLHAAHVVDPAETEIVPVTPTIAPCRGATRVTTPRDMGTCGRHTSSREVKQPYKQLD